MTDHRGRSRRAFVAACAVGTTGSLAGCMDLLSAVAQELIFEDVMVYNTTDEELAGTIEVVDPNDETVVDDRFEVDPVPEDEDHDPDTQSDEPTGSESEAFFEDVFTDDGPYTVSITLDEGSEIDGERTTEQTVEVTDLSLDYIIVVLGGPDESEPIDVAVIQTIEDMEAFADEQAEGSSDVS